MRPRYRVRAQPGHERCVRWAFPAAIARGRTVRRRTTPMRVSFDDRSRSCWHLQLWNMSACSVTAPMQGHVVIVLSGSSDSVLGALQTACMGVRFNRTIVRVVIVAMGCVGRAAAQRPVTRAEAVDAAVTVGPRLAVAQADTAVALAALITARALPNPTLAASYTKDPPPYHTSLELPIDFPWLRGPRVGSAVAARTAAQYHYSFQRAAAALDADTTYT